MLPISADRLLAFPTNIRRAFKIITNQKFKIIPFILHYFLLFFLSTDRLLAFPANSRFAWKTITNQKFKNMPFTFKLLIIILQLSTNKLLPFHINIRQAWKTMNKEYYSLSFPFQTSLFWKCCSAVFFCVSYWSIFESNILHFFPFIDMNKLFSKLRPMP